MDDAVTTRPPVTVELARFLVGQPGAVAKLLQQHVDDGHGNCRVCSFAQRGYLTWPCTIHAGAALAARWLPPP